MKAKTVMVVAALSTAAYGSYPNEGMYSDAVTNIWTGAAGDNDWNTASNWSLRAVPVNGTADYVHVEGYEDIPGTNGIRGVYAKFNSTADLTVTTTGSSPYATRGVIVESGSGQLTISKNSGWYNSGITLGMNNDRPSFFNYSANHAIFDANVSFDGLQYGKSGILPGAEFRRNLSYSYGDVFYFYAGDSERSADENTTLFNGTVDPPYNSTVTANFGSHNVSILANHFVKVVGPDYKFITTGNITVTGGFEVDGGTVSAAELSGTGTIRLADATAVVTTLGSATIAGTTTLATGTSDVSVGALTFEAGAKLVLTGTGSLTFSESISGYKLALSPSGAAAGATVSSVTIKNATASDLKSVFTVVPPEDSAKGNVLAAGATVNLTQSDSDVVVSVTYPSFVTQTTSSQAWNVSAAWSDDAEATSGKHYLVEGEYRLNTPADAVTVFPGDSLTVIGTNTYSTGFVAQKSRTNTVENLYLGAYGSYHFQNYDSGASVGQWLKGNITIASDTDNACAAIRASHANPCRLEANIAGEGELRFIPWSNYNFNLEISGNNSAYLGKMIFDCSGTKVANITISTASALGGNPESELDDGVRLNLATLNVTDDVTLTASNRAWRILRASTINVADGKTFEIPAPFTYEVTSSVNPSLTKTGEGKLILSGAVNSASSATFAVSNGVLQVANEKALSGISTVAFADGTTLLVPYAGIGENGFLLDSTPTGTVTVTVQFDTTGYTEPPETVALFSVKGTTSSVAAPAVSLTRPAKHSISLLAEDVTIDGVSYVRYSAAIKRTGFMVIVR
ncbi:MAG: hypothetical protein K6F50_07720 [Kiritimatiellae bacterium]|nr:hypothetical protein [Kiritimatiellia bacterium]